MVMLKTLGLRRAITGGRLHGDRSQGSVRFAVDGGGGGDDTRVGVDLEQPVGIAGQAVGDRVVGGVQIEGIGRQADRGSHDHIFIDGIGGRIAVGGH